MKNYISTASLLVILTTAIGLSGCTSLDSKATQADSSTATVVASPAATVATKSEAKSDLAGGLSKTKEHLEMAATELKNKNSKGAVDHIEMAHKEIVPLGANAPAIVKTAIEAAGKQIETAKSLVEKHDAAAAVALTKATDLVSKAGDLAKTTGDGMKGMSGGALKAAGEAMKSGDSAKPAEKK